MISSDASSYSVAMASLASVALIAMMLIGAKSVASWRRTRSASASLKEALQRGQGSEQEVAAESLLAMIRSTPVSVLASDRELRQDVYRALNTKPVLTDDPNLRRRPEMLRKSPYAVIDEILAEVPEIIPEDEVNPPQKACLDELARRLSPMQDPFLDWSRRFRSASDSLASVLPMETKLQALLGAALKAKVHFDIDFYGAVMDIRDRAQKVDSAGCTRAIDNMVAAVSSWVDLTNDWYSLRQDAAALIHPFTTEHASDWNGQLRHISVKFDDPETHAPMVWWQSSLLSRSDSLDRLSTWIFREIDDRIRDKKWINSELSAVCSMSSTGVPLATLLSSHYGKRFLEIDEDANYRFPPGYEPQPGDNILLVDSNISTGRHLTNCAREINNRGAFVMAAVVICENDLSNQPQLPLVGTLRNDEQLIRLFTLSDIYSRWKKERELTQPA